MLTLCEFLATTRFRRSNLRKGSTITKLLKDFPACPCLSWIFNGDPAFHLHHTAGKPASLSSLGGNEVQDSVKPTAVGKPTAAGKPTFGRRTDSGRRTRICLNRQERQERKGESELPFGI